MKRSPRCTLASGAAIQGWSAAWFSLSRGRSASLSLPLPSLPHFLSPSHFTSLTSLESSSSIMLALTALVSCLTLAMAAPMPGGGEGPGVDVVKQSNYKNTDLAAKISLKEICYRNLYADVSKYKVKYQKEVLAKDAKGQNVFLFDGIKKDSNDKEFYYEEFCYKQFNVKEHNQNEQKANTAVLGGGSGYGKGYAKRDLGYGGLGYGGIGGGLGGGHGLGGKGLGYGGGKYDDDCFNRDNFLDGYGPFDGGLGYGGGFGHGGLGYGGIGGIKGEHGYGGESPRARLDHGYGKEGYYGGKGDYGHGYYA
ncbi:hypothetical protein BMF94_0839 [Rhodotorula taiwanensis]|uniref:Uncharacterized protein n=1 Tax=Rhodotorula taiwanensis TaxID=741276 RepID=A0A2S5BH58_9BASI|nr:hypothetical protein BMF94_0839 [Rhodotorula taiwanensis]